MKSLVQTANFDGGRWGFSIECSSSRSTLADCEDASMGIGLQDDGTAAGKRGSEGIAFHREMTRSVSKRQSPLAKLAVFVGRQTPFKPCALPTAALDRNTRIAGFSTFPGGPNPPLPPSSETIARSWAAVSCTAHALLAGKPQAFALIHIKLHAIPWPTCMQMNADNF